MCSGEMLGTMLVGAWLLIQQQCCSVYGDSSSRLRNSALVDPLMRRSPLEKNFMRFGRSSPSVFSRDGRLKENFMRFGRPALDPLSNVEDLPSDPVYTQNDQQSDSVYKGNDGGILRLRRAKDNFMRFGRGGETDKEGDKDEDEKPKRQGNFMRFGRNKVDSKESIDAGELVEMPALADELEFGRVIRAKDNFMRFGRDRERLVRTEKGQQDGFIRFGKSKNPDDEHDNCDESVEKRQTRGGDNSFVRFGRGNDKFMRFGKKNDDDLGSSVKDKTILIRVARDEEGVMSASRQGQGNNGFIRFGRSDREKRDTHKHKSLHHLATDSTNQGELKPGGGVCHSNLLHQTGPAMPIQQSTACNEPSCKPFYLPWPFYYQPSLYSLLPNLLTTPQVSMLPTPQLIHKAKRSRSNALHNFIRLG